MEKVYADEQRRQAAREAGFDVMYAETTHNGFSAWTYSDGVRVPMRSFATLEGIQTFAKRNRYAIIYA